jgi:hypothetical protein
MDPMAVFEPFEANDAFSSCLYFIVPDSNSSSNRFDRDVSKLFFSFRAAADRVALSTGLEEQEQEVRYFTS